MSISIKKLIENFAGSFSSNNYTQFTGGSIFEYFELHSSNKSL